MIQVRFFLIRVFTICTKWWFRSNIIWRQIFHGKYHLHFCVARVCGCCCCCFFFLLFVELNISLDVFVFVIVIIAVSKRFHHYLTNWAKTQVCFYMCSSSIPNVLIKMVTQPTWCDLRYTNLLKILHTYLKRRRKQNPTLNNNNNNKNVLIFYSSFVFIFVSIFNTMHIGIKHLNFIAVAWYVARER